MSDDTGFSRNLSEPDLTGAVEERCLARLDHDLRDLSDFATAVGHERFQMGVAAFGGRMLGIGMRFGSVRTGLCRLDDHAVVAQAIEVVADISPGVGDAPYPLGEPTVRLRFPNLPTGLVPFLSNLHFIPPATDGSGFAGARRADPFGGRAAGSHRSPLSAILDAASPGHVGLGIPCLYRKWHPQRDLVWVARQLHSLLVVEPATMASPNDCLNPDAARYWLAQTEHEVPLEPPLGPAAAPRNASVDAGFVLTRNPDP
ncbi:MAG: hypothetical protein JXP73_16830 [Deltaproteobacteria bacterium]|nr:hypothetical protein [Deltaproteobacteria bacterium]